MDRCLNSAGKEPVPSLSATMNSASSCKTVTKSSFVVFVTAKDIASVLDRAVEKFCRQFRSIIDGKD